MFSRPILIQVEYEERHDKIGHYIHRKICKYYEILDCEKRYQHRLEPIAEKKVLLFLGLC